jgi:aromatase
MPRVLDDLTIHADPAAVFACIWDPRLWPRITSHVKRVEVLEDGDRTQRFAMTVESNGRDHSVESIREAEPGRSVRYRQIQLPVFLLSHSGEWTLEPVAGGVRVHLVHDAEIDFERALPALGTSSREEAEAIVARSLKANGSRTLNAIKLYLEESATGAAQGPGKVELS